MKIASIAQVKARFSSYVKASQGGPVVVTRNGKPVAVLLAPENEDELEGLLLSYSPRFRKIVEAARRQLRAGRGVLHDEFWQGVEQDSAKPKRGRRGEA